MTIPLFIIGEGFSPSLDLGCRSILDVAPTVLNILGVAQPEYWQGTPIQP
jgi:bisphosphoglycerate-independent phosphoglycerate mutase (AlkP superfamily)